MKRKYLKTSCHDSYESALKKAQEMRKAGQTASVRETAGGACVYSAGARLNRDAGVNGTAGLSSAQVDATSAKSSATNGNTGEVLLRVEISRAKE